MKPLADRFWAKVDRRGPDECWLWTGATNGRNYGKIGLGRQVDGTELAHRVSWKLHNGPIPEGMQVCHHCDVRYCVNPRHFFLGTSSDNHQDMVQKDRHTRGERSATAKITEAQAIEIRESSLNSVDLALIYPVSARHIRAIRAGECWTHLSHTPTN